MSGTGASVSSWVMSVVELASEMELAETAEGIELTPQELVQIGAEVGLEPQLVRQAAATLRGTRAVDNDWFWGAPAVWTIRGLRLPPIVQAEDRHSDSGRVRVPVQVVTDSAKRGPCIVGSTGARIDALITTAADHRVLSATLDQTNTVAGIHFVAGLACCAECGLVFTLQLDPLLAFSLGGAATVFTWLTTRSAWRWLSRRSVRAFQSSCCRISLRKGACVGWLK